MLKSFLKVALRNIVRQKGYSAINILGLAIGMACSILIFLFVADELSYDRYHENADDIYRIGMLGSFQGNELSAYVTGAPVGQIFKEEVPEIIASTRVVRINFDATETVIELGEDKFIENQMYYVDSTFLDIFTVEFIEGNPDQSLNLPYQAIITESTSKRYFGESSPMGKTITMNGEEYIISGLIKDCPSNSHFHYTILASLVSTQVVDFTTWLSNDFSYTYLLLDKNRNIEQVKEKINIVGKNYVENELTESFGMDMEIFYSAGNHFRYRLQPITDIHLYSHTDFELEPNSNVTYIYIFSIISLFILIVACVNFMNLSTARSAKRAKEVGIRKVVGANRGSLFRQFLFESITLCIIALFIAMIIIESILPVFNNFTTKVLSVGYGSNIFVIPALILLAVIVGLISGVYSAGYLSSIKILSVIKSSIFSGKSHSWFRNILVIFQFTISIGLFICTFIIYSQLNFIRTKDVGFQKENILVMNRSSVLENSIEAFKQELEKSPLVESVSFTNTLPARMFGGFPCGIEGEESSTQFVPRMMQTDFDFATTYNLEMVEGRFFSDDFTTDSFAVVINESLMDEFGLEYPAVGKHVITHFGGEQINWEIIGIVKNFNFRSLHQKVASLLLLSPHYTDVQLGSVKFTEGINKESIKYVKNTWDKFVTETPFDYYIIEDAFNDLHKEEFKTGELFLAFSSLAIFIACLGLLGLASFIAEQKTREIGIRKAMGSSVQSIIFLLAKQFTSWVLIANIIAWPLAWFFMNKWLQNFAYHTHIKIWYFVIAAIISFMIAFLTVIYQTVKAASANPVDSLRYE